MSEPAKIETAVCRWCGKPIRLLEGYEGDDGPRPGIWIHAVGYGPRCPTSAEPAPAVPQATPEDIAAQRESWGRSAAMRGERQAAPSDPPIPRVERLEKALREFPEYPTSCPHGEELDLCDGCLFNYELLLKHWNEKRRALLEDK
jgi:hypothetical protein